MALHPKDALLYNGIPYKALSIEPGREDHPIFAVVSERSYTLHPPPASLRERKPERENRPRQKGSPTETETEKPVKRKK